MLKINQKTAIKAAKDYYLTFDLESLDQLNEKLNGKLGIILKEFIQVYQNEKVSDAVLAHCFAAIVIQHNIDNNLIK